MENELPEGWVEVKIEEIAEVKGGKRLPLGETFSNEKTNYPYIRVADFTNQGTINQEGLKYISESNFKQIKNYTISKSDVYISIAGTIGKTGIIPANLDGANLTENAAKISVKSSAIIDQKFIYYFTISSFFKSQLGEATKQVAMPKLALKRILELNFLLPPLAEQTRIVAKLDAAFGHLETLKTSLARIPELLKKFRQTVLTQAVTGRLTEGWREGKDLENAEALYKKLQSFKQSRYESDFKAWKNSSDKDLSKPSKPKVSSPIEDWETEENFIDLPDNWKLVRFNDISHKVGDIDHKMPKDFDGGIPYLSTGNMKDVKNLDFQNAKRISREDFEALSKKIKPERNDIIFPRYGTIGRNIFIDFDKDFLVSYSCAIIKIVNEVICSKFVYYVSISSFIKKEINKYVVQTTQANIGISSIERFLFPLPPLEEQQEIVNRIEALFAQADALEAQYQSLKAKIDKLPQALLAKAFRGELVPQDPSDEPASVLLEKIKEATAAVGKKGRKSGQTALAFMDE